MSKGDIPTRRKEQVAKRAHYCCEYCWSQLRYSPDPFSVEHIMPRSAGGSNQLNNLALACQGCNNRKYISVTAIDPVSGQSVSLYHPRQQVWYEHFAWSDDFSHIIGLTPIGRATTHKLALNRDGVVNLRRVLHAMSKHPSQ